MTGMKGVRYPSETTRLWRAIIGVRAAHDWGRHPSRIALVDLRAGRGNPSVVSYDRFTPPAIALEGFRLGINACRRRHLG